MTFDFNASLLTGLTHGGAVASFVEASPNAITMVPGVGNNMTYDATGANGLPCIALPTGGATNYFLGPAVSPIPLSTWLSASSFSIFAAVKQYGAQAMNTIIRLQGTPTHLWYSTYTNVFYADFPETPNRLSASQLSGWDDAWHVIEYHRSGGNKDMYVDGVSNGSAAGGTNLTVSGNYRIEMSSSGIPFAGQIRRLRVYNTVVAGTDRTFLRTKFGAEVGLTI